MPASILDSSKWRDVFSRELGELPVGAPSIVQHGTDSSFAVYVSIQQLVYYWFGLEVRGEVMMARDKLRARLQGIVSPFPPGRAGANL